MMGVTNHNRRQRLQIRVAGVWMVFAMFAAGSAQAQAQQAQQPEAQDAPVVATPLVAPAATVPAADPAPAPAAPPALPALPPVESAVAPPPAPVPAEKEAPPAADASGVVPKVTQDPPAVVNSLLYSDVEMKEIRKAMGVYLERLMGTGAGDEDFLKRLSDSEAVGDTQKSEHRYYIYPQFFLASLVYHTPDNWNARINQMEFTKDTMQNGDLKVVEVEKESLKVEWKPANMQKVNEVWDASPNEQVAVERGRGLVTFSLHPNQTFSSYAMKVVEGKVLPVILEIGAPKLSLDKKAGAAAEAPAATPPATDKPKDKAP